MDLLSYTVFKVTGMVLCRTAIKNVITAVIYLLFHVGRRSCAQSNADFLSIPFNDVV